MKSIFAVATLGFCACVALRATPVELDPGTNINYNSESDSHAGAAVLATPFSQNFIGSSGTLFGNLTVRIFGGDTTNPYYNATTNPGALTFVYSLTNTLSLPNQQEGITDLILGTWAGFQTTVALDQQFGNVLPGGATRTSDGSTIDFSFPIGFAPPIFSGQTGDDLILYTDATTYGLTTATVSSFSPDPLNPGNNVTNNDTVTTLGAGATVPDAGTTAIQAALGFAACLLAARRNRRNS